MKSSILIILVFFTSLMVKGQRGMFDICPIKNSEEVPSAIVYKTNGEKIDLKNYIGKKPSVIVFYRGGWCPYCMKHLSALKEAKSEIDKLGYELIAITPDDYSNLDSSVARGNNIDFTLLSDKDINAINSFGIGWDVDDNLYKKYKESYGLDLEWWNGTKNHVLPVPAVFIIKDGKIQYQHVDPKYSKRLSSDILLSFIKSLE